jgi:hypothetical protein
MKPRSFRLALWLLVIVLFACGYALPRLLPDASRSSDLRVDAQEPVAGGDAARGVDRR